MANQPPPLSIALSDDRRRLVVAWADGRTTTAPAPWLYDNADGAFDPASGHRLGGGLALDGARALESARLDGDTVVLRFTPGGAERRVLLSALSSCEPGRPREAAELWLSAVASPPAPPFGFDAYMTDDGALADVLNALVRRGIVFLSGAGSGPGAVEKLVQRFGYVRETNYGRLFDVREETGAATHLAYTAVGLELHTDNPYRDPEPTLQVLHVIEAAEDGGESLFADGFAHAEAMRAAAPARFAVLAATPVEFAYEGQAGERYAARAAIFETAPWGDLKAVRVNHRALRPIPLTCAAIEAWYEAYVDFYARVHAPEALLARRLASGDIVMFDNRRILHGRTAYAAAPGGRWLQGCYAERDGLLATLRRLERRAAPGGGR
ncbi:MAG TPA: TauD/TfdA family dioxygenase [Caulobacteraceae bacterium]|nr:TauD/TfdA family dioxygenase [Caulobacteraceae bacterium]